MSMRTRVLFHPTGSLLPGGAIGAHAANLGFLNDTPISYMKQRHIDSITQAVFTALNDKQDGESASWANEGAGNSVKIGMTITVASTAREGERARLPRPWRRADEGAIHQSAPAILQAGQ